MLIIESKEKISSNFEGTIIDLETVGDFERYFDSRQYKNFRIVIFGFINSRTLEILCANGDEAIAELKEKAKEILPGLARPFYAFNCDFERGVLFHQLGVREEFRELQESRESKAVAVKTLGIPNYDDPFYDKGLECSKAWQRGEFDKAIAHNRACLLKEKDILMKRRFRKPDELKFVR